MDVENLVKESGARADAHGAAALQRHIKIYIAVFAGLLAGTIATVAAWKWGHFESIAITIAVALFIAVVKAFLVAGFFMHLISERKAIYVILLACVLFFAGLMYLTVWSRDQTPHGTEFWEGKHSPPPAQTQDVH